MKKGCRPSGTKIIPGVSLNHFPLVTVITVNYNGAALTKELLRSFRAVSYPEVELIVVDNASTENPSSIQEEFPGCRVILNEENLGFAGANNTGMLHAEGKYLLFINNDTEVEPGFLEPLVEAFESDPLAGIASPKIIYYEDGRKSRIQFAGSAGINPYTMRSPDAHHLKEDNPSFNQTTGTELIHGAAMMVPAAVVKEVGLMPDLFFLYYEELDWCAAIRRAGYKALCVGRSVVYHKESMTVGRESPLKAYYMVRGRLLYMRRNLGGLQFATSLVCFVFLAFPKQTLLYLLKGRLRQLKAYLRGVFWHLTKGDVHRNPQLNVTDTGKKILGASGERLEKF